MANTRVIQCGETVRCTAVSPDGQLLAVGTEKRGVLLLNARSNEIQMRLGEVSIGETNSVAFSPASASPQLLAAGFGDKSVRVWDCSSGTCVAVLQDHNGAVVCVAFSTDGRLLASASGDTTVQLWRADDWHAPPTVLEDHHTQWVTGVSFSCDGRLLASCSDDRTVKLWHILDSGAAAAAPAAAVAAGPVLKAGGSIHCVAFSPVDSRLLAYGGWPNFLVLARAGAEGDGAIAVERKLQGHAEKVRCLAFSPCGGRWHRLQTTKLCDCGV